MGRRRIAGLVVALILVGIAGWYGYTHMHSRGGVSSVKPAEQEQSVPPLSQKYRNESLRLSFSYPEGYTVREVGGKEGGTILIENSTDSHRGIQIAVSPYTDRDTTITAERVMNDIPDMQVDDAQQVNLGVAGEGVAFKSDNEDFGGDSREAWFIVAGHLYQISTYAEYDEVLKAIMGTWSFF